MTRKLLQRRFSWKPWRALIKTVYVLDKVDVAVFCCCCMKIHRNFLSFSDHSSGFVVSLVNPLFCSDIINSYVTINAIAVVIFEMKFSSLPGTY